MIPYLPFYENFLRINLNKFTNPNFLPPYENSYSNERLYIKHDVECNLDSALKMAKIESKYSICSIWLFQKDLLIDNNLSKINELLNLGHIVGYHYDVLDSNDGNFKLAEIEFNSVIEWFERHSLILKYVCPHGNPSKFRINYSSNKDFWIKNANKYEQIYDLVIDYKGNFYSDVSYGFYKIFRNPENLNQEKKIAANFYNECFTDNTLVSIHSHRWSNNFSRSFFNYLSFKILTISYKHLSKFKIIKMIGNKYYSKSKFI